MCDMLHITIMQSFQGSCLNLYLQHHINPSQKLSWIGKFRRGFLDRSLQSLRLVLSTYRKLWWTGKLHRWVEKEWINHKKKIFQAHPDELMLTMEVKLSKKNTLTVRPNSNPNHIKLRVIKEPPCLTYQFYYSFCLLRKLAFVSLNLVPLRTW